MATRSASIKKAQGLIPQSAVDSFWSNDEWNDYYHQFIDLIHAEITDAKLPYYLVFDRVIPATAPGFFPLPTDFFQLLWAKDDQGQPIYEVTNSENKLTCREGFIFYNHALQTVNIDTPPASLTINYRKFPNYIGDWTGADDDTAILTNHPEDPLDSDRGHRLLAYGIAALAKAKDDSVAQAQMAITKELVDNFVDRLRAFNRSELKIIGS